jgi:hypothetical protein
VCIISYFWLLLLAQQLTDWQHETHRLTHWKSAFHQVTTFATKAWVALNSRILAQLNFSTAANALHLSAQCHFFELVQNCWFRIFKYFTIRELPVSVLWGENQKQKSAVPSYFQNH